MQWLISPPQRFFSVNFRDNESLVSPSAFLPQRRLLLSLNQRKNSVEKDRHYILKCALTRTEETSAPSEEALMREPHKYFDRVIITVRSGDGGHGAVLSMATQKAPSKSQGEFGKGNTRRNISYKRDFDGSLILPMGGHGGDVIIYADESKYTLLEFHKKSPYKAKRGGNVDAMGVLTSQLHNGLFAPTLRISVPLGTVIKHKKGKFLADLANPGEEVLVARGGQGGLLEIPEHRRKKMMGLTTSVMRDESDKGLPNAGKSTLLASITFAKPDIADYPFTALMPNLGRLDGDPSLGAEKYSSEATLADLPGLIEGAHLVKGLGRNFLRHLRRTRLLVHVIDAASEDPLTDYRTIKEAEDRLPSLTEQIRSIGNDKDDTDQADGLSSGLSDKVQRIKGIEDYPRPLAVLGVSVLKGIRVNELLTEIRAALRHCRDENSEVPELSLTP